jgi:23S rRNA (adenine2503-C2)-methyltransferase
MPTWPAWCACTAVHPAEDGSERLLLALADGQTVEAVLLLPRDGAVRQQPGRLRGGLPLLHDRARRPAAPAGQRRDRGPGGAGARARPVKKVVFMGMGEPAHNLDNVLEAIQLLGTLGGIGHKHLVFSTVGDPRAFDRADGPDQSDRCGRRWRCRCTPPSPALREHLLPRAPGITPPSWWTRPTPMPAPPATRCSTSGRCWTA